MAVSTTISFGEYKPYRRDKLVPYSSAEITIAKKYLTNPTNVGVWRLEAEWLFDNTISKEIQAIIDSEAPNIEVNKRKISIVEADIRNLHLRTESISFYLRLFSQLVQPDDQSETLTDYMDGDDEDAVIFNLLDFNELSKKYKKALTYFKDNIFNLTNTHTVGPTFMTRIKDGNFMCMHGPGDLDGSIAQRNTQNNSIYRRGRAVKKIELISLTNESLKKLSTFFLELQLINKPELYAIFSPEEELLAPYVDILHTMMPYIFYRGSDDQFFKKMISDYRDDNYAGCISTSGLIAEDCLTQIYETIYRSPVPRKMMLGSLKQKISEATNDKNKPELSHQDVMKILSRSTDDSQVDMLKLTNSITKLLLKYVDEKSKKLDLKLEAIEGVVEGNSFFPVVIKINLEDIIRFRNAVSHKSLDPVGSFEALKSIYCSLSLVVWWDEEKKKIDWNDNREGVIKQFIEAAKTYTK